MENRWPSNTMTFTSNYFTRVLKIVYIPDYNESGETDIYGNRKITGYLKKIVPEEAEIVRRIFEIFKNGANGRSIAQQFNREGIPSPRGKAGAWTHTALVGSRIKGLGILNNAIYIGKFYWNRFQWRKNPRTGNRNRFDRPEAEWVKLEKPELQIIDQELWDKVKAKQKIIESRCVKNPWNGRGPKYMFSGLMICGECGGSYILVNGEGYGCSFHRNRGDAICENTLRIKRSQVEEKFLGLIKEKLISEEATQYLTDKVNRLISEKTMRVVNDVPIYKKELEKKQQEMENIKDAIKKGIINAITQEMMLNTENEIRSLNEKIEKNNGSRCPALRILPGKINHYLQGLQGAFGKHPQRAREVVGKVIDKIEMVPVIKNNNAHLTAKVYGDVAGMLELVTNYRKVVNSTITTVGCGERI